MRMALELLPGGTVRHDRLGFRIPAQRSCFGRGHDVRSLPAREHDGERLHRIKGFIIGP